MRKMVLQQAAEAGAEADSWAGCWLQQLLLPPALLLLPSPRSPSAGLTFFGQQRSEADWLHDDRRRNPAAAVEFGAHLGGQV